MNAPHRRRERGRVEGDPRGESGGVGARGRLHARGHRGGEPAQRATVHVHVAQRDWVSEVPLEGRGSALSDVGAELKGVGGGVERRHRVGI